MKRIIKLKSRGDRFTSKKDRFSIHKATVNIEPSKIKPMSKPKSEEVSGRVDIIKWERQAKKVIIQAIDNAKKAGRTVRVLDGDDIVDIYPDGKQKVVKKLAKNENKLSAYSFKLSGKG